MRIENFSTMECEVGNISDKSIDVSAAYTKLLWKYNALLKQVNGIKRKGFGVLFKDDPEDEDDPDDDDDEEEDEVKIVAKVPRKKEPIKKEPVKKNLSKKEISSPRKTKSSS
jgi:hypothetical protein